MQAITTQVLTEADFGDILGLSNDYNELGNAMNDSPSPGYSLGADAKGSFDAAFDRLRGLQGSDPGFYVLAVHSFIEGALRATFRLDDPSDDSFPSLLYAFKERVIAKARGGFVPGLETLGQLKNQHLLTNGVRHRFDSAAPDDAHAATQHLKRFCEMARIPPTETFERLLEDLKAWDDRRSRAELIKECSDVGYRYHVERRNGREAMERLAALQKVQTEAEHLREQLRIRERELARLEEQREAKDAKVDELRHRLHEERTALSAEFRTAKAKADELDDARRYIELLTRLTVLTRTRADYERSVIRLSAEQKQVLGQIRLDKDFLVKGAAGTGKTLVLLKAIEKAKGRGLGAAGAQDELGLEELQGTVALLTYTNTLVKYDQYIASLLLTEGTENSVSTADAFLKDRLEALNHKYSIDYKLPEELAKKYPAAGLSSRELAAEIENFIWGNDISYEEYVVEGIDRRGMKRPLIKEQRLAIWAVTEAMIADMDRNHCFTRNRAAQLICKAVKEGRGGNIEKVDFIFIDEAQDLPAIVLKALKTCSSRSVILAGDSDQSIYQPGFSFKRAGVDISGRTRVLRTNFRNTVQLHTIAERYRQSIPGSDDENKPEAFRDGPEPELFKGTAVNEIQELLLQRIGVYLDVLGYSPANLCIVAPRDEDLQTLKRELSNAGLLVADIRDRAFQFNETDSLRLTTMHSVKGLDFPVVLLYLPQFHISNASLDPATTDRMARNLIYVAMTRAMDHLSVFLLEDSNNPILIDLAKSMS